jgi:hypothetical protein
MSASDHGLIKTGIPQQPLNPRTYESDVLAERETMRLVEQELALINEAASQSQYFLFLRYLGCVWLIYFSPVQSRSLTRTMMDCRGWEKGLGLSTNLNLNQITLRKLNQPSQSERTHRVMRSVKLLPALPSGRPKMRLPQCVHGRPRSETAYLRGSVHANIYLRKWL